MRASSDAVCAYDWRMRAGEILIPKKRTFAVQFVSLKTCVSHPFQKRSRCFSQPRYPAGVWPDDSLKPVPVDILATEMASQTTML